MKRKLSILILVFFTLITLTGCPYRFKNYYHQDTNDLHSVASNSLLGVRGSFYDIITILEEDDFGRVFFAFVVEGRLFSVLISQKTTETHSYFYSGYNFMLTDLRYVPLSYSEIFFLSSEEMVDLVHRVFSQEEINEMKLANDWNKEINNNRLFGVEIVRRKNNNAVSERLQRRAYDMIFGGYEISFLSSFSILLTTDTDGNSLYVMRGGADFGNLYLVMFDRRNNILATERLLCQWNYQGQLRKFKLNSGWAFYSN